MTTDLHSGLGCLQTRRAYGDLEAGIDSVLLQRLREQYGIQRTTTAASIEKLRDLAIADSNMKREIARFAASVCGAALRGDAEAQNIVKAEAEDLADVTAGALRRCYSSTAPRVPESISTVRKCHRQRVLSVQLRGAAGDAPAIWLRPGKRNSVGSVAAGVWMRPSTFARDLQGVVDTCWNSILPSDQR